MHEAIRDDHFYHNILFSHFTTTINFMVFLFHPSAPHQPRLDWQMWFAALGRYEHNPWLIHLIYRLLVGQKEGTVLAL